MCVIRNHPSSLGARFTAEPDIQSQEYRRQKPSEDSDVRRHKNEILCKLSCIRALSHSGLFLILSSWVFAHGPVLITQPVDETNLATLAGNIRPEANAVNDRGRVPDAMPIDHMLLQLRRAPQQEQAAEAFVDQPTIPTRRIITSG
jgi:hypothetical protein